MNSKEYLENAKHLDSIGAYSISDEIDAKLFKVAQNVKLAQSWAADPNLPEAEQTPFSGLENIGRAFSGTFKRSWTVIKTRILDDAVPTLNAFIVCEFSKDPANRDFQLALWKAKEVLEKEFGLRDVRNVGVQKIEVYFLKNQDKDEVYKRFTNWVNYQRQILGNSKKASEYLRALKKAENILAKKIDPSFTPSKITAPTSSTPSGGSGGGSSSGGSGDGGGRTSPAGKPIPTFDVNKALFSIVYKNVRPLFPEVKPSQFGPLMQQIYIKIATDEELKTKIYQSIDNSSYSPANKAKLKKKLEEKLKETAPGPITPPGPEPGPPGPEPGPSPGPEPAPSPFVSEKDVRGFPYLYQQVNDLDALSDDDFFKIFMAKHNILNRQIMASYEKRNLKPEEYSYLVNFLDRLELKYRSIQQGLK